jgi:hypothetical protein
MGRCSLPNQPVGVWHDWVDQPGPCPVEGLFRERVANDAEIAVVAV